MSYTTIKASANAVRTEQKLKGIKKEFVADIFDDINETKASNEDLAKKVTTPEGFYLKTDYVLSYNPTTKKTSYMSAYDAGAAFTIYNSNGAINGNRAVTMQGYNLTFAGDFGSQRTFKMGVAVTNPLERLHVGGAVLANRYRFEFPNGDMPQSIYMGQDGNLYYSNPEGFIQRLNNQFEEVRTRPTLKMVAFSDDAGRFEVWETFRSNSFGSYYHNSVNNLIITLEDDNPISFGNNSTFMAVNVNVVGKSATGEVIKYRTKFEIVSQKQLRLSFLDETETNTVKLPNSNYSIHIEL